MVFNNFNIGFKDFNFIMVVVVFVGGGGVILA